MSERVAESARLEVTGRLDRVELDAVTWLVEAATEADGVRPLSEHVMLHLRYGGEAEVRNVLVWAPASDGGGLAAYAHLDVTDAVEGASAELVVDPRRRRRGYGRAVVETLLRESPDGRLRLWAHGAHPGAESLARSLGFTRTRALWQLRRSLFAALPAADPPPGIRVRTFRPGQDEDAWVALNARAFAGHPEQGSWTRQDLERRMREPWFDPAGFFLAERAGGGLVGFHWTKVHGDLDPAGASPAGTPAAGSPAEPSPGPGPGHGHGHEPIGEVYVLGIDPQAQGLGLGRTLTVAGLAYLRSRGLGTAMLYVDADNAVAIAIYTSLGFARWDVDLMFRHDTRR